MKQLNGLIIVKNGKVITNPQTHQPEGFKKPFVGFMIRFASGKNSKGDVLYSTMSVYSRNEVLMNVQKGDVIKGLSGKLVTAVDNHGNRICCMMAATLVPVKNNFDSFYTNKGYENKVIIGTGKILNNPGANYYALSRSISKRIIAIDFEYQDDTSANETKLYSVIQLVFRGDDLCDRLLDEKHKAKPGDSLDWIVGHLVAGSPEHDGDNVCYLVVDQYQRNEEEMAQNQLKENIATLKVSSQPEPKMKSVQVDQAKENKTVFSKTVGNEPAKASNTKVELKYDASTSLDELQQQIIAADHTVRAQLHEDANK